MWCLALVLIIAGMTKLAAEWLDDATEQITREEAERRRRAAEYDDDNRP